MPLPIDGDGDVIPFGAMDSSGQAAPLSLGSMGELLVGLAGASSPWRTEATKTDTTDFVAAGARGGTTRNYVTDFAISNTSATAVVVVLKDNGSTVLWRANVPAGATLINNLSRPIRSGPNATLTFAALTATTSVIFSASGYSGA